MTTYLVDLLQYQRTDPSSFVFDVHLVELVLVRRDGADLPHGVLVAQSVKEVVDPTRGRLPKRTVRVDVH